MFGVLLHDDDLPNANAKGLPKSLSALKDQEDLHEEPPLPPAGGSWERRGQDEPKFCQSAPWLWSRWR